MWDVTLGTLVAIALAMGGWQSKTLVAQGELIASMTRQIDIDTARITRIEDRGSPSLQAIQRQIDANLLDSQTHFARLDAAVMESMKSTTELKGIVVSIGYLSDGQKRIEELVRSHINQK